MILSKYLIRSQFQFQKLQKYFFADFSNINIKILIYAQFALFSESNCSRNYLFGIILWRINRLQEQIVRTNAIAHFLNPEHNCTPRFVLLKRMLYARILHFHSSVCLLPSWREEKMDFVIMRNLYSMNGTPVQS